MSIHGYKMQQRQIICCMALGLEQDVAHYATDESVLNANGVSVAGSIIATSFELMATTSSIAESRRTASCKDQFWQHRNDAGFREPLQLQYFALKVISITQFDRLSSCKLLQTKIVLFESFLSSSMHRIFRMTLVIKNGFPLSLLCLIWLCSTHRSRSTTTLMMNFLAP